MSASFGLPFMIAEARYERFAEQLFLEVVLRRLVAEPDAQQGAIEVLAGDVAALLRAVEVRRVPLSGSQSRFTTDFSGALPMVSMVLRNWSIFGCRAFSVASSWLFFSASIRASTNCSAVRSRRVTMAMRLAPLALSASAALVTSAAGRARSHRP
jgi:hypothetical protein